MQPHEDSKTKTSHEDSKANQMTLSSKGLLPSRHRIRNFNRCGMTSGTLPLVNRINGLFKASCHGDLLLQVVLSVIPAYHCELKNN